MLPDFPKIKEKFKLAINKYLKNLVRQEPLLSQIREQRHFEGNKMTSKTEDGELDNTSYKEISGGYSIKREDVIAKGTMAYIENIQSVAEELKKQQAKLLFDKISEVTKKTGNIVNGKGQPFSFEIFIETMEKIQIDFDEMGKPYLPTLVVSPQLGDKLNEKLPEWESNPEYKKKLDEVIERKRQEWNDRESNRKLVD